MADNLGPMAWLFLQENVQVQYLQKIALRAENKSGTKLIILCYVFLENRITDSPEGAKRLQTGVSPPVLCTHHPEAL